MTTKRPATVLAAALLFVVSLAPAALATPADGNGNKEVEVLEFLGIPIFCDADELPDLSLDFTGFIQFKAFTGQGNPNLELAVFHIDATFSNSSGESWTWRDRGPDRSHLDMNGDVVLTISGRSGLNNIGHVVINLSTGEILLLAGRAPFGGELFERSDVDYACERLAG